MLTKINPCLWFDHQAEEAAHFYTAIFKNSKIVAISHYPDAGQEVHGRPAGSDMTVAFELEGQSFTALNGGPFSSSTRPSPYRLSVPPKKKSITTGSGYPKAVIRRRRRADG
jgi:predicted 3-demethylubiquinone-9 3-methyltransferase (glyoxalase superfamily)